MTYGEALEQGYTDAECSFRRGYISRKVDIYKQPVKEAGGRKKGRLYVEFPHYGSSGLYIRQYLNKPSGRP